MDFNWCFQDLMPLLSLTKIQKKRKNNYIKGHSHMSNDPRVWQTLNSNLNALYAGINQAFLSRIQLVQNAAACLLTTTYKTKHISSVQTCLHLELIFSFIVCF